MFGLSSLFSYLSILKYIHYVYTAILKTACAVENLKLKVPMALSHDLPIYRDTMKLLSLIIEKTKCYPRFYLYTVGEKMVNINLVKLSLIY